MKINTFFAKNKLLPLFIAITSILFITITFNPTFSYQPLALIDGAGLYKKKLDNGNSAYLQVINLHKMQIDQLIGEVDDMGWHGGKYYKGEAGYYSPFFKTKLFKEVTEEYQQLYGEHFFSLINCAFFEEHKPSTQLSFPIKFNGKVVTSGSSLYGPIGQPKNPFYSTIRLKALIWDDKEGYITDYDPVTGAPLNKPDVKNAIVSYQYADHPAKILVRDRGNRYHVIGTLNADGTSGDELLLIMTVDKATLDSAADLLRKLGVKRDIITIDGGTSTYLFNHRIGNIILPVSRKFPHYLGFRKKGKKLVSPIIKVSQPAFKVQVEQNKPFLILWRDNLDGEVKIELYDGNKPIQTISPHTTSDGVYEWTPDSPVKKGYSIRISSLKDGKIFGTFLLQ